jgi:hypothetical protein
MRSELVEALPVPGDRHGSVLKIYATNNPLSSFIVPEQSEINLHGMYPEHLIVSVTLADSMVEVP